MTFHLKLIYIGRMRQEIMEETMRSRLLAVFTLALVASAVPAAAHAVDYSNPYDDHAEHRLRFAALEFSMPTDPLLWSSDPGWEAHHTPARLLANATEQLRQAVPVGTNAEQAGDILRKAGAHCGPASSFGATGQDLTCTFKDTEYPYGGDYTDDVVWRVTMPLQDGRVNGLTVVRDWSRH